MHYEVISHLTHDRKAYPPGSIIDFDENGKFAPDLVRSGVIRPVPIIPTSKQASKPEPEPTAKEPGAQEKKDDPKSEAAAEDGKTPTAYCLKCKQKRKMVEAKTVILRNKKKALQGKCQACLTKVTKMI